MILKKYAKRNRKILYSNTITAMVAAAPARVSRGFINAIIDSLKKEGMNL